MVQLVKYVQKSVLMRGHMSQGSHCAQIHWYRINLLQDYSRIKMASNERIIIFLEKLNG